MLGYSPHRTHRKGDVFTRWDGSLKQRETGVWKVTMARHETDEWDCMEAMLLLVRRFQIDVPTWRSFTKRFRTDLFVYLSMPTWNKGLVMTPEAMVYLGERGIEAGFDIYYEPPKRMKAVRMMTCPSDRKGEVSQRRSASGGSE